MAACCRAFTGTVKYNGTYLPVPDQPRKPRGHTSFTRHRYTAGLPLLVPDASRALRAGSPLIRGDRLIARADPASSGQQLAIATPSRFHLEHLRQQRRRGPHGRLRRFRPRCHGHASRLPGFDGRARSRFTARKTRSWAITSPAPPRIAPIPYFTNTASASPAQGIGVQLTRNGQRRSAPTALSHWAPWVPRRSTSG